VKRTKLLSIVTPLYNEEDNVILFFNEIQKILNKLPYRSEIIFVDDGSVDGTAEKVASINTSRIPCQLVRFSRNFGKEAAVSAGLEQANGDAAIIIDSDLQHPIDKIPAFVKKWEKGADVVVGVRTSHGHNTRLKRWGSNTFYKLINRVSEMEITPHATDFRLVNREVIDHFNSLTEHNRMTRGLIDWLGFDRAYVKFKANERQFGIPSYSYKKLINLAVSTFISHSFFPLRLAGYLGAFSMVVAGLLGMFVLIEDIILNDPWNLQVSGVAMLALVILFLMGLVLSCLGLFGLYIASIHDEVSNRPVYIVRKDNKVPALEAEE
jgi:dolichol-phosphate mannosyltransferase